jgi:hypothetical protein
VPDKSDLRKFESKDSTYVQHSLLRLKTIGWLSKIVQLKMVVVAFNK